METKNQILKIPPFNFLHFSDSMVSFSSKSESYKFFPSKQILAIFQILAMGYGTFRSIIEANSCNMVVPPIMPTCFGQKMSIFPEFRIYLYSFLHMQNEPFDRVWRMTLVVNCQTMSPKYRLESNCKLEKFQHPENKLSLLYVDFWPNILLYTTQTACFTKSKYSLISKQILKSETI